jgi:glutamate/aspartate transport system permease protein
LFSKFIAKGLAFSLELTLVASVGGLILGTALAMMRMSHVGWIKRFAVLYVDTMRSVPLVMVILWFYLLMPLIIGRAIGAELSAFITFVAFESAYFSEIMRAGMASVGQGQGKAAQALGMSPWQSMRLIVLPQAFKNMIPILLTQVIVLFQDTSLVYAIGAYDLLKGFVTAGRIFGRPEEAYLLAAVVFFLLCFALSSLVKFLQNNLSQRAKFQT